ncbi:MAG TPA: methylmalonyl-CoA mutase small subunit, partial [Porphyromonadaceae bacterium]|nr:methylmalonyl-CoA mutase small subunit [Porphyromonadaceae bacterium]
MMNNRESLFSDFPSVSYDSWKEKVVTDLKGVDFEKKLVWRTKEGFNVQPMYRKSDIEGMEQTQFFPGEFPYVRGTKTTNNWFIRQTINVEDYPIANKKAINLLGSGVTSLNFILPKATINKENLSLLLEGISCEEVEINFSTCVKKSAELVKLFAEYIEEKGLDKK